jgi:hypothetical protein
MIKTDDSLPFPSIPMRIFISYSRHNSDFARGLEMRLNDNGYNVWLDTDKLRTGQLWREEIVQAIAACDYFLILLSSRSIVSENVVRELSLAETSAKPILPVMLEQVEIPDKMKYQLAGLQCVLVDSAQVDQAIAALLDALPAPSAKGTPPPPAAEGKPKPPAEETPTAQETPTVSAGSWDKARLWSQLSLAIGPMASLLLESLPDPLRVSDRDTLRAVFQRHQFDLGLLDAALAHSLISPAPEPPCLSPEGLAEDSSIIAWLRLQLGPIADVIWDDSLRRQVCQAPASARTRLERLGVEPRVVDELLRRCTRR